MWEVVNRMNECLAKKKNKMTDGQTNLLKRFIFLSLTTNLYKHFINYQTRAFGDGESRSHGSHDRLPCW